MCVVAHVNADLVVPGTAGAGVVLRITFPSGRLEEEGPRDWGGGRRGLLNYKPSNFTSSTTGGNN